MSQRAISQYRVVAQLLVGYLFTVFIMCCYLLWFCDAGNFPTVGRMKDYLSYLILSDLILLNLILSYFLESGACRRSKGMAFITVGQFTWILKTLNLFLQLRIDKKKWGLFISFCTANTVSFNCEIHTYIHIHTYVYIYILPETCNARLSVVFPGHSTIDLNRKLYQSLLLTGPWPSLSPASICCSPAD